MAEAGPNGPSPVAQLRLATNEGEEPQFHQLSAWGKVAEFAASYLKKGRLPPRVIDFGTPASHGRRV